MKILINGKDISDIIVAPQLVKACNGESEVITLSGKRKIDRMGTFKATLSLIFGVMPYSRWEELETEFKTLFFPVTVVLDGKSTVYLMSVKGELPTVYIYNEDGKDYCAGTSLTLVEVG